jgi:hypothetical protein
MRTESKVGLACLCVVGLAAACGGRSGIELWEPDDSPDASLDASGAGGTGGGVMDGSGAKKDTGPSKDASSEDAAVGPDATETSDATPPPDHAADQTPKDVVSDWKDLFDQLPPWLPDTGIIGDCVGCLKAKCANQINACYNDPACVQGIQCLVMNCLIGGGGGAGGGGGSGGGGGINLQCVMNCFDNKISAVMEAVAVFQCVTQQCAQHCGGQFLPDGGLGGAGGGGGSGPIAFNPWELTGSTTNEPEQHYLLHTRIPRPEEVAPAYPWLADVLEGRMPDPPPPCLAGRGR